MPAFDEAINRIYGHVPTKLDLKEGGLTPIYWLYDEDEDDSSPTMEREET